jgi:hypothetical protein
LASGFVISGLLAAAAAPALPVAFAVAAVCFRSDLGRPTAALSAQSQRNQQATEWESQFHVTLIQEHFCLMVRVVRGLEGSGWLF